MPIPKAFPPYPPTEGNLLIGGDKTPNWSTFEIKLPEHAFWQILNALNVITQVDRVHRGMLLENIHLP